MYNVKGKRNNDPKPWIPNLIEAHVILDLTSEKVIPLCVQSLARKSYKTVRYVTCK